MKQIFLSLVVISLFCGCSKDDGTTNFNSVKQSSAPISIRRAMEEGYFGVEVKDIKRKGEVPNYLFALESREDNHLKIIFDYGVDKLEDYPPFKIESVEYDTDYKLIVKVGFKEKTYVIVIDSKDLYEDYANGRYEVGGIVYIDF